MSGSLNRDLVATIDAWASGDTGERSRRAAWRRLAARPDLLTRNAEPAHFTASALPTTPDGARVCLVLHRRIELWVQPGGHFEVGDATVVEAASREMLEETGLAARIDPVPLLLSRHAAPCGVGEWHLDLQMLAVTSAESPVVSPESLEAAWFDVSDLPRATAPGVERLVVAAISRLRGSAPPGHRGRAG